MNTSYYEKKYIEYLKKRENELLNVPMPKIDRDAYMLYFETGNRLRYEKIYFSRREYLTVFGLTAVLDRNMQPDRLFKVLESVLNEPTWVLPAHGSREHIEGKKQSIDLFAAETAGSLAEILYLIRENNLIKDKNSLIEKIYISDEKISEKSEGKESSSNCINEKYISICIYFLKELKKRIFDIFLSKSPCDWWENAEMNWSAVCAGNIGIAAYYVKKLQDLLKDSLYENIHILNNITCRQKGELTDKYIPEILSNEDYDFIMNRVTDSMICYLKSMGNDGACSEGVGYYKYGMEYFLKFYDILRTLGRQENINKIGDFHNISLFLQKVYLGNGNSVNFSDCFLKNKMKTGILCMLSSIYDDIKINEDFVADDSLKFNIELMEILGGEECHRWLGAYSDYMWVKKYGKMLKTENYSNNKRGHENRESWSIFEETQWYIKKWGTSTCFYIKGGNNDESHNHNDVGSFGYIFEGEEIICDLGLGEYTKDYFGKGRYNILCNSSKGHNVPMLDGLYQKAGKIYCADEFYGCENSMTVSFGAAYDDKGAYIVKRKVTFGENGSFSICDNIKGAQKISERLITRIKPEIKENIVILDNKKSRIYVKFLYRKQTYEIQVGKEEILTDNGELNTGFINVIEDIHINHDGQRENIYIICFDYT